MKYRIAVIPAPSVSGGYVVVWDAWDGNGRSTCNDQIVYEGENPDTVRRSVEHTLIFLGYSKAE